jgi:hypothetical protein
MINYFVGAVSTGLNTQIVYQPASTLVMIKSGKQHDIMK